MFKTRFEWRCTVFKGKYMKAKYNLDFSVLLAEYFRGRKIKGKGILSPVFAAAFTFPKILADLIL